MLARERACVDKLPVSDSWRSGPVSISLHSMSLWLMLRSLPTSSPSHITQDSSDHAAVRIEHHAGRGSLSLRLLSVSVSRAHFLCHLSIVSLSSLYRPTIISLSSPSHLSLSSLSSLASPERVARAVGEQRSAAAPDGHMCGWRHARRGRDRGSGCAGGHRYTRRGRRGCRAAPRGE